MQTITVEGRIYEYPFDDAPEGGTVTASRGFEGIPITTVEEALTHADMLDEHGYAWAAWMDYTHNACETTFLDSYKGEWESPEDWALEQLFSMFNIPAGLAPHITPDQYLRDAEADGVLFYQDDTFLWHVFEETP